MAETLSYLRDIPVAATADVLVVGGGPAGIAAAVASGRNGAKTVLVERFGFLGGNATAGLVGPFMTSYSLDGKIHVIRGIFDELVQRAEALGGAIHPSKVEAGTDYAGFIVHGHHRVTPFDPEAVKLVAAEMCLEAGVELRLHTFVVDALVEGDQVTGVVVASKSGLEAIRAKVTIDCSADADIAARAGAPFHKGRESDGLMQPMTLFFRIGNVDDARVNEYIATHPEDRRPFSGVVMAARERGEFPIPREGIGIYKTPQAGIWRVNTTRLQRLDGTNVQDLTRAEIEGRRQVMFLMKFFREYCPGLENCILLDTAATIGVRETRRIVGEYTLTAEDLASGRDFDDTIALCGYPIDLHPPEGAGSGLRPDLTVANVYQIPYRSLVPVQTDRLLVAGRCVSATHEALAAIRVMPPAFAMGQAAGTAAALSVAEGVEPRKVPVPWLQETLVKQGAYLGDRVARRVRDADARSDGGSARTPASSDAP
ncbi:MAG: FAD-dependent oxidoreductase [Chloroflexi bacterium]|nr:FAD-dependent oxidoreductase [Chloroflexota bacterium]